MTTLGIRPASDLPRRYKGFYLVRSHGRVYGIPDYLDLTDFLTHRKPFSHPAVLSAASRQELEALIDAAGAADGRPELLGRCENYGLVRYRGAVYGVPGRVDLETLDLGKPGVLRGGTAEEVREQVRATRAAVPVDVATWLPVYESAGYPIRHPQFEHLAATPSGYRFTASWPIDRPRPLTRGGPVRRFLAWLGLGAGRFVSPSVAGPAPTARARRRTLLALLRLFLQLLLRGAQLRAVVRFLRSRHYPSQILLAQSPGLVFLTSMPYTYGQNPWVVEIEDPTTLFYPLIENGTTCDLRIRQSPYYPIVKTLLESDHCRGIVTHLKSTAAMLPVLFDSETIRAKVHYTPLGVRVPRRWQRHDGPADGEPLHLVFINSWCQVPDNFYVRGGLDVLEAFAVLRRRYPHLRLTLRTNLPALDAHYHRILEGGGVRVVSRFLPAEEMETLMAESHVFLLPAARIHVVSLLQAMSYGLAVVTSDGWGIDEYVTHGRTGVIVPGRYGKASWADQAAGMLREDYTTMHTADPAVVQGMVEAVARLVEDREYRRRLGRAARREVRTRFNLEGWNRGLQEAFEKALAAGSTPQ
jgi:glycosyltransferase involved in cell wall biosynthesis